MKKLLLALALIFAPAAASAQCNGVFPNNTVCGNVTGSPNVPIPTNPSAFLGAAGGANGQIQYNNGGALGGFTANGDATIATPSGLVTIQPNAVTSGKIADGSITSAKIVDGAVTSTDLAANAIPLFPSRAAAAALDLSAFSVISTQGYSTPGDGGGATFQKIVGNFIDTRIIGGSITNNGTSGCTNGTYYTTPLAGGSGRGSDWSGASNVAAVITVAGNVVTSIANVGGYNGAASGGYAVGNVLTAAIPGCTTTPSWTISSISTPTGSFTDSAGNKWQIVYPAAGLDARAMGVKFDWAGTDGTATDNYTTLQNALSFAGYPTQNILDTGGGVGGKVLLVKGTAMVGCGATVPIVSPQGVITQGQGNYVSVIKFCNTFSATSNQWELCNSFSHIACFGTLLQDFQIFNQFDIAGVSARSTIYTNNAQHEAGMRSMVIYPGACGRSATYEIGYGGATYILMDGVEYKGGKSNANCGGANGPHVILSYGTTQVKIRDINVAGLASGSGGPRQDGLVITGGFVTIEGIHAEQVINPATINIPGGIANGQVRARSVIGGVDCVGMFSLTNTNTPGNFLLGPPNAVNGCTRLVSNGQPGGSNYTGPALSDINFNP